MCRLLHAPTRRPIHTATHCNTATNCKTLQYTATHCNTATQRNTLQHTAIYCNTLHHTATRVTTPTQPTPYTHRKEPCMLQHTASKSRVCYNTLQHRAVYAATHCNTHTIKRPFHTSNRISHQNTHVCTRKGSIFAIDKNLHSHEKGLLLFCMR